MAPAQAARCDTMMLGLLPMSSSISRGSSTMVSGCCPFSDSAYLTAWARLTNRPPKRPFCSCATHCPLWLRPMKTMVEGELHEGGSTSFMDVVLPIDGDGRRPATVRSISFQVNMISSEAVL